LALSALALSPLARLGAADLSVAATATAAAPALLRAGRVLAADIASSPPPALSASTGAPGPDAGAPARGLRRRGRRAAAPTPPASSVSSKPSAAASFASTFAGPVPASLRTRRLGAGGEPGRVSPILGLATATAGGSPSSGSAATGSGPEGGAGRGGNSATSSSPSSSAEEASSAPAPCRLRPPRDPLRRRRGALATEPAAPSRFVNSSPPVPPRAAGSGLALPASPSSGSDI